MRNLAGSPEADAWCSKELSDAGIEMVVPEEPLNSEVRTRVTGKLGGITFTRAWYYWVAKGRVPIAIAQRLYEDPVGRKDVRVAGFAGNTPPERPWVSYYDGDEHVEIDPDGSEEAGFDRLIAKGSLPADSKPRFAKTADGLAAFVESYHIDSEAGLKLFADAIRGAQ